MKKCKHPTLFASSKTDTLVKNYHSEILYKNFGGGIKELVYIPGNHSDSRPEIFFKEATNFLKYHLFYTKIFKQIEEEKYNFFENKRNFYIGSKYKTYDTSRYFLSKYDINFIFYQIILFYK